MSMPDDTVTPQSTRHSVFSMGTGSLVLLAFFVPFVRGCGMDISLYDLAQRDESMYLYAAAGVVGIVAGFGVMMSGARVRSLLIAHGVAGVLGLGDLLRRTSEALSSDESFEPLLGFWLMVLGLLGSALLPWAGYRALAPRPALDDEEELQWADGSAP